MNYELAKKLKDAGFPMKQESMLSPTAPDRAGFLKIDNRAYINIGDYWYAAPDLPELIEACGKMKFELWRAQAGWGARTMGRMVTAELSAEAAVAKLWLALHNST